LLSRKRSGPLRPPNPHAPLPAGGKTTAIHRPPPSRAYHAIHFWQLVVTCFLLTLVGLVVVANRSFLFLSQRDERSRSGSRERSADPPRTPPLVGIDPCAFRRYPEHRYYRLHDQTPAFLRNADYIYGEWPALLPLHAQTMPHKLCVDQSAWLPPGSAAFVGGGGTNAHRRTMARYPFADGTNPSILSMERIVAVHNPTTETMTFVQAVQQLSNGKNSERTQIKYVATACMTNSQCAWGNPTPTTFSNATSPDVVLTTLLLLDDHFQTLAQATIRLKRDGPWGRTPMPPKHVTNSQSGPFVYHTPGLDDARLFVHSGQIWVSYREGKGFGYETQVLNPIHLSLDLHKESNSIRLKAEIWASETTSFCCGRNMALMENPSGNSSALLSLTWVDPVTVIEVDTTPHVVSSARKQKAKNRNAPRIRVLVQRDANIGGEVPSDPSPQRRRLLQEQATQLRKKSHVHGTNAFMVPLPGGNEFLGVAHFHRPHDRRPNPYAKFGHHYTHALFTVAASPPYELRRLSAEFVLPQAAIPAPVTTTTTADEQPTIKDAEIIQFASGLEVVDGNRIIIAYGINDCEAAVAEVSLVEAMNHLLRPVKPGTQVVDVMEPLKDRI
jgi:hypothetical protein